MILDLLENASCYAAACEGFAEAFAFLERPDLGELPVDTYQIDGERIYAMVAKEPGRTRDSAQLEVHRKYTDIHVVLQGVDEMGWKPVSQCTQPATDYDEEKDFQLFDDEPEAWLRTEPGRFAVFFPADAHIPLISNDDLHKVIVKVAVE